MQPETPTGETPVVADPKNDAVVAATPVVEKAVDPEVERLRKEADQATMRANQLANQLKAKEDAEAATKAKELEAQNEYKTLYEQERAKREEFEQERQADEQKKAVQEAESGVLADYSDEVKDTAKDLGLNLGEVSEEAVAEFKSKLDKIQTRIGSSKVTPNNPGVPSGKKEYDGEELRLILADPQKRDAYFRNKGGVAAAMMDPQV